MEGPSAELLRVAGLPKRELERLLIQGERPQADALAGWVFRGWNTSVTAGLLRIRKFLKGFYAEQSGQIFGYNMPARQGRLSGPWTARPSDTAPRRFGFFSVRPPDAENLDNAYLHSLLLDYSQGGNRRGSLTNLLRDYLVCVGASSDDLLLGKAYVAIGPLRIPVGYFVLERHQPTDFRRLRLAERDPFIRTVPVR